MLNEAGVHKLPHFFGTCMLSVIGQRIWMLFECNNIIIVDLPRSCRHQRGHLHDDGVAGAGDPALHPASHASLRVSTAGYLP